MRTLRVESTESPISSKQKQFNREEGITLQWAFYENQFHLRNPFKVTVQWQRIRIELNFHLNSYNREVQKKLQNKENLKDTQYSYIISYPKQHIIQTLHYSQWKIENPFSEFIISQHNRNQKCPFLLWIYIYKERELTFRRRRERVLTQWMLELRGKRGRSGFKWTLIENLELGGAGRKERKWQQGFVAVDIGEAPDQSESGNRKGIDYAWDGTEQFD